MISSIPVRNDLNIAYGSLAQKTGIQSQVESYQWLLKWYFICINEKLYFTKLNRLKLLSKWLNSAFNDPKKVYTP